MSEEELRQILSANIKKYRGLHSWSQAQLAEKVDISINFLSDIETKRGWVSPYTLVKLAQALEIEVYELFRPEEEASGELKDTINQFINDFSPVFEQFLGEVSVKYFK
jgi:transcriptional regulator with XRE-family HTH domain